MSTDYYVICEGCKEAIDIASHGFSGFAFYSEEPNCMRELRSFLEKHTLCESKTPMQIVSEHHLDNHEHSEQFTRIKWSAAMQKWSRNIVIDRA